MIDRRIKFRHIQCFVEIAREESLKRAAETLSLTQPAISKTLKELEEIIGAVLFERSRAGVAITPEGARLLRYATMSIAALQQGLSGLESGGARAALRLGALPSVAAWLIPRVATRFAARAPDIALQIIDGPHGYLTHRLKLGELDLVVGRMADQDGMDGLTFTRLYRERIVFVARAGHPVLSNPSLADVLKWPVLYPPANAAIRNAVDRFMIENGVGEAMRRIETVSVPFGRQYLRETDAIWIISEGVVRREVEEGHLVRLPMQTDTTLGPIGVMTREDWAPTLPAQIFREEMDYVIEAENGGPA